MLHKMLQKRKNRLTSTGWGPVIRALHGAPAAGAVDALCKEVAGCEGDTIVVPADRLTGRWCPPARPTCRPVAVVAALLVATGFCCTVNTTCVEAATRVQGRWLVTFRIPSPVLPHLTLHLSFESCWSLLIFCFTSDSVSATILSCASLISRFLSVIINQRSYGD